MTRPVTLALQQLGDNTTSDLNFRLIQAYLGANGPLLNSLAQTVSRAAGGFSSDTDGQLVVFGAIIINTGTGIGSTFGVGVTGASHSSTGTVDVTLTETFPTDTLLGVTMPRFVVAAMPFAGAGFMVRAIAPTATTVQFKTYNSSGTLTDSHFAFVGIGTLAP